MGVLNPKNLMSPLTNTVNLVAIILIVLLFAVYRLSSGRYSSEPIGQKKNAPFVSAQSPALGDGLLNSVSSAPAVPQKPEVKPTVQTKAEPLDVTREIESLEAAQNPKPAPSKGADEAASLSEVEKALGLR